MIDLNKFLSWVEVYRQQNPQWRYGQALFNTLDLRYPSVADRVRGTDIDPYYIDDSNPNKQELLNKFFEYITQRD